MIIVFEGNIGSGKTTLLKYLENVEFNQDWSVNYW